MREAIALIKASWRTQRSYRVSIVLSILSLGVTVLPVYYIVQSAAAVRRRHRSRIRAATTSASS